MLGYAFIWMREVLARSRKTLPGQNGLELEMWL
jgi:hypothetical protein